MIRKGFFSLTTAIAFVSLASAVTQNPASQDPGQVILNRACTVCHTLGEITKFKGYYGRDQWADVVRTMRADGASVQDSEVTPLVDYLFKTYGRVDLPEGEGRKILEATCVGCHDLTTATKSRLTKSGWQDLIGRMITQGAKVDTAQIPTLSDYLAKNFGAP
jgi:cytochrome c5